MDYKLVCTSCNKSYGPESSLFRCRCGSILEVKFDYSGFSAGNIRGKISQARYSQFFPIGRKLASMGEGGTKLVEISSNNLKQNKTRLYLKVETSNPTRSFKDRGSSVEITKALELGFNSICCGSTGNMGLSLAAYSKRNGIKCTVFMGRDGNRRKMKLIEKTGAKLVKVDGDFNLAISMAEKHGTVDKSFVCGDYHYRKEGQKSVVYEIVEQMDKVPDYIFVPVGNATLFAATYKGLNEFKKLGLIQNLSKLVAVQSKECAPLVTAYTNRSVIRYVKPHTQADAIAVGNPVFGGESLYAIQKTKGYAMALEDREILKYRKLLRSKYNISAEPGGAVSFACFMDSFYKNMEVFKGKKVVAIVSGNND